MIEDSRVVDVSRDWVSACDLQRRFTELALPIGASLDFGARCKQVRAVGGDGYCILPLKGDRLAFSIGDASGKSLPAALMMASVQSSLRTAASFVGESPTAVVAAANDQCFRLFRGERYATVFYGAFDGETRTLRYVNAGHNPPLVLRQGRPPVALETGGIPLGVFPSWDLGEGALTLDPGDLIVAYTDGVTEALDAAGAEWGVPGLLAALESVEPRSPGEVADAVFDAMEEFSGGRQADDATVIVARVR